jgi:phospholipase C
MISDFFSRASAGTLPPFCMVDPRFGEEAQGLSNDDHPFADIRNGQAFLNQVYQALSTSSSWANTLMIVVYDECGGFLEHVVPQTRIISTAEQQVGNDGLMGFRVPCMLLGPRAPKGGVSRYPFDPSSIHALLAWRFGLGSLGVRGADPNTFNLAYALDFSNAARTDTPVISVPAGPFGAQCSAAPPASGGTGLASGPVINSQVAAPPGGRFSDLRAKATSLGFA